MGEQNYTKRELDHWTEDMKNQLNRIEAQVLKTNGRVSALENWRWMIVGGLTVITILVIPLIVYVFKSYTSPVKTLTTNK